MVKQRKKDIIRLIVSFTVLILVNFIASEFFTRYDFTSDKRYTLSPLTKQILKDLKDKVQVTVYLEGEFPAGFKRLRRSTSDLLSNFETYSDGNLQFTFVNPMEGDEGAQEKAYQELLEMGIEPTNLSVKTDEGMSQKIIYPAALISYKGERTPVKLLQSRAGASPEEVLNNSIENLEYAFASAIKKITGDGARRIGFTEGHAELSDLQLSDAMASLSDAFEVGRVDLKTMPFAGLDKLDLLIIAKPDQAFSEAEKYKIDYYLMQGKPILWAIDQVNAELDSLQGKGSQLAFPKKLNLDDMLFKYGVRLNYELIADMNCAQIPVTVGNIGGQSQIQLLPWLFYPIFVPVSNHPLVRNLDGIRSEFSGTIDLIANQNIRSTVILTSSPFSRKVEVPTLLTLQMVEQEPDPKLFQDKPSNAGVLLEGSFPSNFKNRPVPAGIAETVTIPAQSKPAKMIIFSDGDLLKNQVNAGDGSPFPLGFDRFTQQQYGNKDLLLNIADFLTDESGIIGLRNKEIKLRMLDRARIRQEKSMWQLINIALPILLLILCGIFQHYYRIRKYAR